MKLNIQHTRKTSCLGPVVAEADRTRSMCLRERWVWGPADGATRSRVPGTIPIIPARKVRLDTLWREMSQNESN